MKMTATIAVIGLSSFVAFGFLAASAPAGAEAQRWGFALVALVGLVAAVAIMAQAFRLAARQR